MGDGDGSWMLKRETKKKGSKRGKKEVRVENERASNDKRKEEHINTDIQ